MKEVTELALLVVVLLIAVVIWALLMATPAEPRHAHGDGPIGLLWHPATPITDWTPHTSTVLQ